MDPTIKDFESASAELETIVKKMEEGDLTLEKALELYERGVQLSRFCHSKLEEAERRLEVLSERGELKPAPASFWQPADEDADRPSAPGGVQPPPRNATAARRSPEGEGGGTPPFKR